MSKKPPKYGEEVRRIAEAGLVKHRAKGNVVDLTQDQAGQFKVGPDGELVERKPMSRADRQTFLRFTQIAIERMANRDFEAWADCLQEIRALAMVNEWQHSTVMDVMRQIEEVAVATSEDPNLGIYARNWLKRRHDVLRFLPRGNA